MKQQLIALAACLFAAVGCGGSGSGSGSSGTAGARGHASMVIHWPKSTRLIPGNAQCIEILIVGPTSPAITLTNNTDYVTSPGGGGTSNVTTVQLTPGDYTVTAKAWPGTTPTGGGNPTATGTASLTISGGQSTAFGITMASTIDHVEVTANGTTLEVSTTGVVTRGAPLVLPLVPTLLNQLTVVPKDASSDNLVLFPASLTGSEITNGDGKITVGGTTSALNNATGSVLTANLVANSSAGSAYSSSVSVNYSEGGSTVNSFTIPVVMHAISFGTPAQITVNAQWTALNAVSQATATGNVFIAFANGLSATGLTENIQLGYAGSIGGIAPSHGVAFRDLNDGFWLTNAGTVNVFNFGGTVNQAISGHTGFLALAATVSSSGKPFVVDASGAYEYGATTPVTSTAIQGAGTVGFIYAAGAAPGGGYTYYTKLPTAWVYATSQAGVDTAIQNATPDAMAASSISPLLYIYESGELRCETTDGTTIGQITVDGGERAMTGLAVFVDPATGKIDGTAIGINGGNPIAFGF